MVIKHILFLTLILFLGGCALKQPIQSQSAIIFIKTPSMKFYDKGFIKQYPNYVQVQIFSAGTLVLNLKIYSDRICKDTFECQSLSSFNKQYLNASYDDDFLQKLFSQKENPIYFKDSDNKIIIKVTKD
jgi:hypothetical protein